MFKRIGESLVVGKSNVPLLDGEHDIYIKKSSLDVFLDLEQNANNNNDGSVLALNPELTGNKNTDPTVVKIATYTYNKKNGDFSIKKYTTDFKKPELLERMIMGRSVWNNARVHNGPLYDENGDIPISGYLEGFPVDFNYESFLMSTIALASYNWVGGRACFTGNTISRSIPFYTAKPIGGCSNDMTRLMISLPLSPLIFPLAYATGVLLDQAFKSKISTVFSLYIHRRYTDIQINNENMFEIRTDTEHSMSPLSKKGEDNYNVPDFNGQLSMFNLMQ